MPEDIIRYVFYADKTDEFEIRSWAGPGFHFIVQKGEDLGQRLQNAFCTVFNNGTQKAVAVASDVPDLSAGIMNESIKALDRSDVVIGPCYDGGYYLLGMSRLQSELFDGISWSTEQVYRQTLAATMINGLTVHKLQTLIDIDTVADIRRWSLTDRNRQPAFDDFLKDINFEPIEKKASSD